jgi:peptide/nickel transport system permease protein
MAFDSFKPVFLVTDILLFLLALATAGFLVYASRRQHYRMAWAQLRARRLPMACMGIILIYAGVALLDSVHYHQRAYAAKDVPQVSNRGAAVYRTEIISLLDGLCSGLRSRAEKTFSAPLATRQFTKELVTHEDGSIGRDYPRLLHGGSHLANETDKTGDIISLTLRGVGGGLLVALAVVAIVLGLVFILKRLRGAGPTATDIKSALEVGIFFGCFALLVVLVMVVASKYHVFGTGQVGQDVLYGALKGCRVGLVVGILTTLIATPLAVLLGIMAGYLGKRVDDAVQYVYTTLSAIPEILLIAAVMLIVTTRLDAAHTTYAGDTRLVWLCIILGIGSWTGLCRLIRGETLKLRELEYIHAAEVLGVGRLKIMLRHILPNVVHIVLISVVLRFSGLVLAEAVLAYVGIGVDPSMESWGNMINAARLDISRDPIVWWNLLAAFVFMFGLVLPANIFGDAVRDALDPRLQAGGE